MEELSNLAKYPSPHYAIKQNRMITVREYLQISNCADEEPYSTLALSIRSKNCLNRLFQRNGTVHDILELPLARLMDMRNAGAKTIQEIFAMSKPTVLQFFQSSLCCALMWMIFPGRNGMKSRKS